MIRLLGSVHRSSRNQIEPSSKYDSVVRIRSQPAALPPAKIYTSHGFAVKAPPLHHFR